MSPPPDPPPGASSLKPVPTAEERRARHIEQLTAVRLRVAISRKLDGQSITDPNAIAAAFGMPVHEAVKLLNRYKWREGDVAQLQALAERLGVQVPDAKPLRV